MIEKGEYVLLKRLVNISGYYADATQRDSIQKLAGELEQALIRAEEDMPTDVVRFNSWITIGSKNGWHKKFQLVMPKESDVKTNKISVLAPMGLAVVGYAQGDSVIWNFPTGEQELTLLQVEQAETPINIDLNL